MYTGEEETQAMKMSLSHVLMKAWRIPVFWVLAFSVLVSLFKGTTSQCSIGNRPLILSTVNESPNRLSSDHLFLPTRNINCQWKITAREGDRIALTVVNIDLISSYNCPSQSITIFDGETENNRNLGNFCGRQRGQILYSSVRYMLIKFISSGSLATGGFNLTYAKAPADSACRTGTRPTRLTGSTSYSTELRFPSSGIYYPNNALCDWLISVPNGYVVQIRVNSINMELSSNCNYDRMDIYDGSTLSSPLLARICRNYSQIVNGTTSDMLIHFTSDSSFNGTGFIVNYKAVLKSSAMDSACRTGTRPTRLTGSTSFFTELRFPYYGIYYPNNAICDWLISVSSGYIVQLRVNSVNMEISNGCIRNRMDIYDGSTNAHLLARICTYYSQTVNSSGTNMLIRFTSDNSITGIWFSVSYKAVLKIDSACWSGTRPTHLTGSSSYFTDLRFPSSGYSYPNNALCDWLISVSSGYIVQLRVNSVNMESSSGCITDRMGIYDGSTDAHLLARICTYYSQTVNSSGTNMLIRFTSDSSITGTGFSVSYKAVLKIDSACWTGTRPTYLIGSSSYFMDLRFPSSGYSYPNNALCDWLISVSTGYIVQLRVNSVNMETNIGCRDRMDIYDGSTDAHLLARICTYYSQTVNSSGTNMLIRFTSDSSITGSGFSVSYKAVLNLDAACGLGTRPTRLTGSISYFTDLRFPSSGTNYTNNALCDWLISVPTGYVVQLRVNSVNMETVSGCTRDHVDIYDGSTVYSPSLARICSYNYTLLTVYTTGTNMLIRFTSDFSVTGTGFSVSYKAVRKSFVTTTVDARYHGDYTSQSSPSTAAIIGGVAGACLVLMVLGIIIYQCRKKSSRSPARRSNAPVVNRDNVRSRNRRRQAPASQDRQDVYTLPTSFSTTTPTAPFFTNSAYSTFGDELPSRIPLDAGNNQYQPTNFTGIGPPDYSDAPPPYSEVVNGCYTHDS